MLALAPATVQPEQRAAPKALAFFENLPPILRAEAVAQFLGISIKTIYDWRYRAKIKEVPPNLFIKFNRQLYVQTEALRQWMASQNADLESTSRPVLRKETL